MAFLAPWMLWGLAAASLPVILHFFYRSRYRTVPWAAMKFLLTSIEQTSRRLRFQELLLLAVRTALLLLLALALARPSSRSGSGGADGDAVDAVFVIDTSMSMGARDGAVTRLERAKAGALAVIDHLPPHSTVQVVASSDRAESLGPVAASNLEQAREIVRGVELSHLATDALPGVLEALAALDRGHSPNKEVYLFSDLQRAGWERQNSALTARLQEIGKRAGVYLVRCGTRTPRNVSIVGVTSQSGIPHTGERAGFSVLVRNSGTEPVRDLTVTLEVDGRTREKESHALPSLAPGETQAVTLTGKLEKSGLRVVTASVSPDELDADNVFHKVLQVRDHTRALVVDGSPSEQRPESSASFYLMHSLRPVPESSWGSYHVQPRMVSPVEASAALLESMDVCILANVAFPAAGESTPGAVPAEFVERLDRFVKEGRGLLIFGGPRVSPELYNKALFEEHALLPYKLTAAESAPATRPVRPDPGSIDAASFLSAFREEPLSRVAQANVFQWLGVEERETPGSRVALRYVGGKPAVATRTAGAGEVVLVTTSADARWTDLPLRHTYLPLVHVALSRMLEGRMQSHNRTAGDPFTWRPRQTEDNKVFFAIDPDGRRARLGVPTRVDGQAVLTISRTVRAGVYRLAPETPNAEGDGPVFAAVPDARECEDLESLTDRQIDERLGFAVHHITAGDDPGVFAGGERLKREWTLWILGALLLIVAFETALAWYCGRGW